MIQLENKKDKIKIALYPEISKNVSDDLLILVGDRVLRKVLDFAELRYTNIHFNAIINR